MKKWQHLKKPFQEIKDATNNFEKCIGKGGYGLVYEGKLSIDGKEIRAAVKRLNEHLGQGLKEFLTEIQLLSGQEHENLVSLLGYCDHGKEKIIIYEYAERGSLDRYIRRRRTNYATSEPTPLTWMERLKICAGAARGLDHLHNHVGEHQTIIHRDIKSANILLDENWVAKISDLGLSRLSLAGLDRSAVISRACGTPGYCEPEYIQTGIVKKESDIYSFGMVLFEVLCGRLCTVKDDDGYLLSGPMAKYFYENEKLDAIIDPSLRQQMGSYAMRIFSSIAYECLQDDRGKRPAMYVVARNIEEAIKIQEEYEFEMQKKLKGPAVEVDSEEYWRLKLPKNIEDIIQKLDSPPVYTTSKELFSLLRKGVFFDHGHRFFKINNDGIKCETISRDTFLKWKSRVLTRSASGGRDGKGQRSTIIGQYPHIEELKVRCKISTSMLSLGIKYAASLVFSFGKWHGGPDSKRFDHPIRWVWIKWQCSDLVVSSAHFAQPIENDFNDNRRRHDLEITKFRATLWHFVNHDKNADFDVMINRLLGGKEEDAPFILIHGIEFRPVEMMQQNSIAGDEGELISKKDINWEEKMPDDYEGIIHRSHVHLEYTTKKDLYFLLCNGIHIDDGRKWFFLCNGYKCVMLPAEEILRGDSKYDVLDRLSLSESRFKEVIQLQDAPEYRFKCKLDAEMLQSEKTYGCYLVFKFINGYTIPDDKCLFKASYYWRDERTEYVHLKLRETDNIPLIKPRKNYIYRDSLYIPKVKGCVPKWCFTDAQNWMEQRNDGWMEVLLINWVRYYDEVSMKVILSSVKGTFHGIIVQGLEFRPAERDNRKGEKFPFDS